MSSGQHINLKLMRGDSTSWGFRLQGGKDYALPLSVVKVNPNSLAAQAGLQIGDIIIKISGTNAEDIRHKEAQEAIYNAGNYLELTIQRGDINIWKPQVTPVGNMNPGQTTYTKTSLQKPQQTSQHIGSEHNVNAKPFTGATIPSLVHKQYNSPVNLYSEKNIAETLEAHTEVLTSGAKGINFMRPDAPINKESAVYQMVHDEEIRKAKGEPSVSPDIRNTNQSHTMTRHVEAPVDRPASERQEKANQNICAECERLIVGVFVRIKDKSLHAECFRCATCGTSLKNVGYYSINDKLYCDIHAKQMASLMKPNGGISPVPVNNQINTLSANLAKATISQQYSQPQSQPQSQPYSQPQSQPYSQPQSQPYSQPQSQTQSQPSNIGAVPYQSTEGMHQLNSSSSSQYSKVIPSATPKPVYNSVPFYGNSYGHQNNTASDSYRPFTGRPKFQWPPPTQSFDPSGPPLRENPVRRERPKSMGDYSSSSQYSAQPLYTSLSDDRQRASNFTSFPPNGTPSIATYATSFTQHSTTQQTKAPPTAAPKPQFNAQNWTSGSTYASSIIPGPGQSTIPGSRPAPRRGRGLLKSAITGTSIPICGTCGSPIRGPFIVALNKAWCPHHFTCANARCNRSLEDIGFVEEQGKLYCENCYEAYLAPICSKCGQRIKEDCLNALEKQWHPECFSCAYCKRPFGNSCFYLEEGLPYCEKDWNELFTTKCVSCGFAIEAGDRWVEALNQNYHSNCFMCTICHKNLEGQSFYAKGGRPYCKSHAR
ncbi:PDZ and LIM domain protein Zasp-like isoform X2 [Oppia nitens]|uniref:PDZ and LIM domain protein Zasp-like isoform X2 n=1 Tax=Oppia nitens TaxID=1686743 RepID=UPI0023D9F5F9|nr:PDZ and LIM domain protein Zasp-like isoform X2 [Oppia nitens]